MKKLISLLLILLSLTSLSAKEKVLATVNGQNITMEDIKIILASSPNVKFENLPQSSKEQIISQAIDKKIITNIAMKSKIIKSKEYKKNLIKLKENLAFILWLKNTSENIKISDKEVKKFYKKNKKNYQRESKVKARHILVGTKKEAKKIIKQLNKSKSLKKDFIKMAKELSTGPSGKNGGDLGFFEKTQMVAPFSKVAFSLPVGGFSKTPVKTQFGYHIIFVEEKKAGGSTSFKEVKPQIMQQLQMKKFGDKMKSKTAKLRKKSRIKIY